MNEEELFCKLFPEYVVNGKPLSPYFDLFESGYEQAEKHIEELKKKLKEELKTIADKDLSFVARFDALAEENAELKADNDARKFAMAMSEKVEKQLREENAELKKNYEDSLVACGVLKAKVDTLAQPSPLESMQDVLITTQKAQNEKQKEQLTEAREIISIMRHLLFDVWGYIAIPLEKRVNNFLKQSNF